MALEALMRNNPYFRQLMLKDTEVVRQEVAPSNDMTNEPVVINHRRFIPGRLQEKRRPLM